MGKINMSIIPRTISMSVAVKPGDIKEVLDEIERRLHDLNGSLFHHSGETPCYFKKSAISAALDIWTQENRVTDGFILYVLIRGHVVDVSARSLKFAGVSIGRGGGNGELKTSDRSNIISYTY